MKIYPACECREGAEHYYDPCQRRATLRIRYKILRFIPVSRLICEICASVYSRNKVTIENLEEEER